MGSTAYRHGSHAWRLRGSWGAGASAMLHSPRSDHVVGSEVVKKVAKFRTRRAGARANRIRSENRKVRRRIQGAVVGPRSCERSRSFLRSSLTPLVGFEPHGRQARPTSFGQEAQGSFLRVPFRRGCTEDLSEGQGGLSDYACHVPSCQMISSA